MIHPETERLLRRIDAELQLIESNPQYSKMKEERNAIATESNSSTSDRRARELSSKLLATVCQHLREGAVTIDQAVLSLQHQAVTVRACGLEALGRLARNIDTAADHLFAFATSEAGKESVFGPLRLSHVAVASLFRAKSKYSLVLGRSLLDGPFKEDEPLQMHLENENLI
jgi:hypothetical protein